MLVWLSEHLVHDANFDLFFSLTVRAIFSFITALFLSFLMGPYFIDWLKKQQINQVIRNYGPKSHFIKCETPTMGGIMIITSIIISVLIWSALANPYIWFVLFVLISYGIIGFSDDYYKIVRQDTKGISNYWKYFWESIIALTVVYIIICTTDNNTTIFLFFSKETILQLGIWYVILAYFVIIGTGNAVNLTDGLDGLAIVPTIFVAAGLAFVAWITSNLNLSSYLHIAYINLAGELMVICTAIVGAGIGFLWFNAYPAQMFMGDVGSLALGGALGTISVLLRQELLLFIMGGLFVIETISVILQVSSFKLLGKRIFLMVPIHHHYELKGLPEPLIIVRFWIISLMLVIIGLVTLKVR